MRWVADRRVEAAASLGRSLVREYREKNLPFMAGSLAYSAFVSLLPLLFLLLLLASALGGTLLVGYVTDLTGRFLTPAGQDLLATALSRATRQAELSVLGLGALVWGMLKVFRALDTAFSAIYGTPRRNDLADQVKDGLVVFSSIGVALLAMVVAGAAFALLPPVPFLDVVNLLLLIVGLSIAFFPIYYVFPDVGVTAREVVPGTVAAAIGWTVLQALFQFYVSFAAVSRLYGAIGGIILLITWFYFGALVILIGASINVVLSGHVLARPAAPEAS